jgi:hypothetical protein
MSLAPTEARQRSHRLAGRDPEQALAIARGIADPWFRCQSLSHVARYWPGDGYQRLLEEAVEAADTQDDAYKRATVAAWPIRAYLERGSPSPAKTLLGIYTPAATNIENMGGRSEALLMLFQAARPFAGDLWKPVFRALVQAAEPALAWRQRRNVRLAISMVAAHHPELVQQALDRLSDEKTLSAVRRDLQNGKHAEPRPFFWLD